MSGVCNCGFNLSQTVALGWDDPPVLNVIRIERGTLHNCPYMWLCYTSRPGSSAYGFVALLPGHHLLQAVVVQLLHLLEERNRSTLDLCVLFKVFCTVQSCDVKKFVAITQQQP